ncbi:Betaine reductase complex component B subunit beta [invertebrate metagenome]|uniref:Betaine reductase complex component B subunit beta n=1 Tax=invertebrate metagenome TaxID=1711999 RepID=A0A2H9T6Q0_9ZZZZ
MPIVQIANLLPVATTTGSNRIVPGFAIPYPLGNPELTKDEEYKMRYHRVDTAIQALATSVSEQTVFKVKL